MTALETGIRDFVLALQECWPGGDSARLADFYHEDVVLLPPDLGPPLRGREAVVASYDEFLRAATLEAFSVEELALFPFAGSSAEEPDLWMAHLTFQIAYGLAGERYVERGMEVYTISRQSGRPAIVWRSQIVLDSRLEPRSETAE